MKEEVFTLENIDHEDISDVLVKVEKSFNIKIGNTELNDVKTFGDLCDFVVSKIELRDSNDCTTQQAFYKLRNAIVKTLLIEKAGVTSSTKLMVLFPRNKRRQTVRQVEEELGFPLKVLRPKYFYIVFFAILFVISLLSLFVNWKFGLVGMITSLLGTFAANKFGKELEVNSVGELTEKISRENYIKSRRNNKTINKAEVVKIMEQLFSHDLGLAPQFLTREATFN